MALDLYGHLGQAQPAPPANGERTRETVRTGFSNLEKIALAGVIVSTANLLWQVYRVGRA